jgi:hypothetical protein
MANNNVRATVLIADYIGADAGGKLNALGVGFTITGLQANGATGPMYVALMVDLPATFVGQQVPVAVQLRDETTGNLVEAVGPSGDNEAVRVTQLAAVSAPHLVHGLFVPPDMFSRVQLVMAFPQGLPLKPGGIYAWEAEVNGDVDPRWTARFHVLGPPPQPVYGGPAGPAGLPTLPPQ